MEAVTTEKNKNAVRDNYLNNGMHDNTGNKDQFVVFQLGTEEYGVNISQAKEIIKPKNITNVPNTPEHVLGVINLRGQIVPVVDMKKRFSIELDSSEETDSSRIITVEVNDALIGIKVDGVNEVVWLDQDKLEPAPEVAGGVRQEYLIGIGKIEDRLLVLVDLNKILFEDTDEINK